MAESLHRPVLLEESLEALACSPGGVWVDGTLGGGGHAEAILRATAPGGRLVGIDRDGEALARAARRLAPFGERALLRHADFRALPEILDGLGIASLAGVLLDLGLSSDQLDDEARGFSFRHDGPLDMRMDRTQKTTAADLVNTLSARDLASLLKRFGEEPDAARVARAIEHERAREPFASTRRLAATIAAVARPASGRTRVHPATRTFQALRIAVNHELDGLDRAIEAAVLRLEPGRRMAVIAFHSLEDRIVKRTFRGLEARCVCPRDLPVCACGRPAVARSLRRRAVRPSAAEVAANPRSRSARLRAVESLPEEPR